MYKAIDKWLPGYLRALMRRPRTTGGVRDLLFCTADHFEPCGHRIAPDGTITPGRSPAAAAAHTRRWLEQHRAATGGFADSSGNCPRHTVFYAAEEYVPECVDLLAEAAARGELEIEVHLHHRNDTANGLREKLRAFAEVRLPRYAKATQGRQGGKVARLQGGKVAAGQVSGVRSQESGVGSPRFAFRATQGKRESSPQIPGLRSNPLPPFAFLHGNWALCNSRPDGDWCGVDNELSVLAECGCYADFTFPSAPSPTQPRMVNSIYRPRRDGRRAADHGTPVVAGSGPPAPDALPIIIQGPLALGLRPACRLVAAEFNGNEDGSSQSEGGSAACRGEAPEGRRRVCSLRSSLTLDAALIAPSNPPSARRVDRWVRAGVHVTGRPEWTFVKIHTHGCDERMMTDTFITATRAMHEHLSGAYNDGVKWRLHYVTAREMYNIIRAAEDGHAGNPNEYRDYEITLRNAGEGSKVAR